MAIVTGTFNAGTPISNVIDIGNAQPLVLIMPDDWTQPANLKCLYSPDSTNFYQLYHSGKEWIAPCVPKSAWVLETNLWPKASFIRLVSVFGGQEVNQEEERVFQIITNQGAVNAD
jgi:hypothetical protein